MLCRKVAKTREQQCSYQCLSHRSVDVIDNLLAFFSRVDADGDGTVSPKIDLDTGSVDSVDEHGALLVESVANENIVLTRVKPVVVLKELQDLVEIEVLVPELDSTLEKVADVHWQVISMFDDGSEVHTRVVRHVNDVDIILYLMVI